VLAEKARPTGNGREACPAVRPRIDGRKIIQMEHSFGIMSVHNSRQGVYNPQLGGAQPGPER
jgi:hypothetical protein